MIKRTKMSLIIAVALLLCGIILFFIQLDRTDLKKETDTSNSKEETEIYIDNSPLNGLPIQDNVAVYENDIDNSVKHVYITALSTIDEATGETVTLSDINGLDKYYEDYNPEINIIFQEGDEKGPYSDIFTVQSTQGNAIMRARGYSARSEIQKSFKIKLNNNTELFLNQETLNMNKHITDDLRIINKLCFDLFESIPNFTSLRTQFVNIYIKDLSKGSNENYENYGLFTMIEQPNKRFLESHGLDKNGNLYKARYFSFENTPALLLETDVNYNKQEFERVLEISEGKGHAKLIDMVNDVENTNLNINDVVDEHFNRDNYLTWMALNIMLGNLDATAANFLLYSPSNAKTWYFLPWDYDKTLYYTERARVNWSEYPETQYGLGVFWGIPMHRRFFKDPQNVEQLSQKIEILRKEYVTTDKIQSLTEGYKKVVREYVTQLPDIFYLGMNVDVVLNEINKLDDIIEGNIERYYANLQSPMPIWMDAAVINQDGSIDFVWDYAYDLQGDNITYQLQIARDAKFNYLVFNGEEQIENNYTLKMELPADRYYFRVIIRDENGHTQLSMEMTRDDEGDIYHGVLDFEVK